MFSGSDQHTVDDKGRVAIPARFREALRSELQDERLVVTNFRRRDRPCVDAYPVSAWRRFVETVDRKKRHDERIGAFEEWYVSNAREVEPDSQGRILIPPMLREYARLGREVVMAGLHTRFRIWDLELFRQVNGENEREVFQDPSFLKDLGL